MGRKIIFALLLSVLIVAFLGWCTSTKCFYLPPPIATLYLVPTSLYICFLILRRADAMIGGSGHGRIILFRRIAHATGFGVSYVIALPIGFWLGGALGGFLMQKFVGVSSIGEISGGVIFYSTIFVSIMLITIIGIRIGWIIGKFIGRVLEGL